MPGNGGTASQPSFPAPVGLLTGEELEERIEALSGALGRAVAGLEYLNNCFDRLEAEVKQTHKEVILLRQSIGIIEGRSEEIPVIKKLLVEALTRDQV